MAYIDEKDIYKLFENGCGIERLHVVKIDELPRVDAVEVVRCKDCENYKPYKKPVEDFDGCCIVRECETDENDFCSYGKRKVSE